jgi:hypothetical protein
MIKVVRTTVDHFDKINIQPAQGYFAEQIKLHPEYALALAQQPTTYSGIDENGNVIGIMGLMLRHPNCGEGWAIFSDNIRPHIKSIVKEVRKFLYQHRHVKRIYCTASVEYPEAHKLLKVLGFKVEGILEAWDALGTSHIMYVIINNSIDWETR